jgi:hypothetical protein
LDVDGVALEIVLLEVALLVPTTLTLLAVGVKLTVEVAVDVALLELMLSVVTVLVFEPVPVVTVLLEVTLPLV